MRVIFQVYYSFIAKTIFFNKYDTSVIYLYTYTRAEIPNGQMPFTDEKHFPKYNQKTSNSRLGIVFFFESFQLFE